MEADIWGSIDINHWSKTPHVSGRIASEADVQAGKAVFYIQDAADLDVTAEPIPLPRCAILTDDESKERIPVIIIQAERHKGKIVLGYRPLTGGNGVCTIGEVDLLDKPDERFL